MVISIQEGFPHSDIRGSTIARISPRLFAACHVLHRLLAPRHPPNALLSLHQPNPKPARRTKPRPTCTKPKNQASANTHTLTQSTNQPFHLHLSKEQSTRPAPRGPPGGGFGSTQLCPAPKGSQERISQPVARPTRADMEATGFEPVTPCLQSRCSTS